MQEETNKVTLSTDELSTKVMNYLDFSLKKSVGVICYPGASYTFPSFESNFVDITDEACLAKLTGILNYLNIEVIVKVNYMVRMDDG